MFVVAIGSCSVDFFNYYWLSPSEINIHQPIFGKSRNYRWDQVAVVKTICWKGKSDPLNFHINVAMMDGYKLQLPEYELHYPVYENDVPYFSGLKAALRGATFSFDSSAIEPSCRAMGVLVEKP